MPSIHPPAEPVDCNDCLESPRLPRNVWLPTGELVWPHEDLRIAGRGLDFVWTRTYRSRPASRNRYWDHGYNLRAERTPEGLRIWTGAGEANAYREGARGTFSARGVFAEGRVDRTGQLQLRFSSGGVWEFRPLDEAHPAKGCIARIADRNGNALRFAYNPAGQLDVVTDALGRDVRIGHDNAGRLASVTDFTGRGVSYVYGASGELTAVTYPVVRGTPTANDFPAGATIKYTYASGQMLTGITDRAGAPLLDVEYARAFDHDRVSTLRWGRSGNPIHVTYHRIDEGGAVLLAIVNDGNGNVRELLFDKFQACVVNRTHTGRADPTRATTLSENRPARPLREGEPPFYETRFSYDNADGLLTSVLSPDGSVARKRYEIDVRPDAPPIERGNLRSISVTPGPKGGDQPELVRRFEYLAGFGCTCGQALVTRETDPRGAVRGIEYDQRGNAIAVVERDGSRTTFAYNASGDLVSRSYPPDEAGAGRRDLLEYSDRHGQLISERLDAAGLALTTTYEYDALGRLALVRDPAGHQHRSEWNAWDLIVRRTLPDSMAARPAVEDTLYDVNRNAVARIIREQGREVTTRRTYDVLRRVRTVSRESEAGPRLVVTYDYDANGNRVVTRRGESHVVRLAVDTLDRPYRRSRGEPGKGYREVTFDYDGVGNLVQVARGTGSERSVTRATYDGYSRVIRVDTPEGASIHYARDANGNAVRQIVRGAPDDEPVSEATQTFDAMDRMTRRTISGKRTAEPSEERWQFDSRSRLVRRVDAAGQTRLVRYDPIDRPIEIDEGAGQVSSFTYDANSNVLEEVAAVRAIGRRFHTRYVRDRRGRLVEVTGPQGMSRRVEYAADDRPGTIVLAGKQQLGLDYDGLGRPSRVRHAGAAASDRLEITQTWSDSGHLVTRTDPNGNTTRYVYDAAENIVAIHYADGTRESSSFDSRGNCLSWTDANGTSVVNAYDRQDRLVRRQITPGGGVANDTTAESYQYDALGRMTRAANDQHTIERSYDALSRVVTETQDGRAIQTTYRRGARAAVSYPSGRRLEFDYQGPDLQRIRDAHGAAIERDASAAIRYARTRGPVTSIVAVNDAGLPERLATAAGGSLLDERRYRWDESANVIGVDVRGPRGERTMSYTVDFLGRLRGSTTTGGPKIDYALDAAGNRITVRVDGREERYSLDSAADRAANRYTETPAGRRSYDGNGNLLSATDERGRHKSMKYDYLNRLVEYRDDASQMVARYSYDCLGRRLLKSVTRGTNTVRTRYVFEGDDLVEEHDETTQAARTLVRHGRAVYGMVAGEAEQDRWFISDLLGSVVAEFDNMGAITRAYAYGDFGEIARPDQPNVTASPVLFAGYVHDDESGFYYVRTRYLDPATGRFLTRDPSGIWEDGRNRGNAYVYAGNNPVAYIDPTGLYAYSCSGPWPGPRTVHVEFEFCSKSRKEGLYKPVCRAFRASGQSQERVWNVWLNDFTGVAMPGAGTTRAQLQFWFGGPDGKTNIGSKSIIAATLDDVFTATKSDDFDIDCEGGSGDCASANAYVAWGGEDVNLCNNFFNSGFSNSKKAAILIHELTHAYNDTDDYFYYQNDGNNQPFNSMFGTGVLRENADTYEQFTLDFFLP